MIEELEEKLDSFEPAREDKLGCLSENVTAEEILDRVTN